MSDASLVATLDASQYPDGVRVVTKGNLDIMDSANRAGSAVSRLESSFGGIRTGAAGFGAAKAALRDLESPLDRIKDLASQVQSRIIRIGATVLIFRAVGEAVGSVTALFRDSIKAVDDYQQTIISMTASLTQIGIMNSRKDQKEGGPGKNLAQVYMESATYAGILAEKMREVDINSAANYGQIMDMLQVYTSTGKVLDVNNERQMAGFTALSNAIPALTKGQDITRQMTTEMRAFATGTLTAGSMIAKMIDQFAKSDGKGGLKGLIAEANRTGKSVLEIAATYLEGFTALLPKIQMSFTTAKTSLETAVQAAQRKIFTPIVSDIGLIIQDTIKQINSGTQDMKTIVQGAWSFIRDILFNVTKEADGTVKAITLKPEVAQGFVTFGKAVSSVAFVLATITTYAAAHLDILTKIAGGYLAYKVIMIAVTLAQAALTHQETVRIRNAEKMVILEQSRIRSEEILAAAESLTTKGIQARIAAESELAQREAAAEGARMTRLATMAEQQSIKNANMVKAATLAVTAGMAEQELAAAIERETLADIQRNEASKQVMQTALTKLEMKAASLAAIKEEAAANTVLAESEAAVAGARRANLASQLSRVTNKLENMPPAGASVTASQNYEAQLAKQAALQTALNEAKATAAAATAHMIEMQNAETAAIAKSTAANNLLLDSQTAYNVLERQGIEANLAHEAALQRVALAQEALNAAMVQTMLPSATAAALRYNTSLAEQGIAIGAVTAAELAAKQVRFASYNQLGQNIVRTQAYNEALRLNTGIKALNTDATMINNGQMALFNAGMLAGTTGLFKYTAGLTLATAGTAALTAAKTALSFAVNLVGGALGVVLIALYAGYTWWNNYGEAARKAIEKTKSGADAAKDRVNNLIKEAAVNRELADIADKMSKKKELTPEQSRVNSYGAYSKDILLLEQSVKEATIERDAAQKQLNDTMGTSLKNESLLNLARKTNTDTQAYEQASKNVETYTHALVALKKEATEHPVSGKAPAGMPPNEDGVIKQKMMTDDERSLLNTYLTYLRSFWKDEITIRKEGAATAQLEIENAYKAAEISQKEHIQRTHENQQQMLQDDVDFNKKHLSQVAEEFAAYKKKYAGIASKVLDENGVPKNPIDYADQLLKPPTKRSGEKETQATYDADQAYKQEQTVIRELIKLATDYGTVATAVAVSGKKVTQDVIRAKQELRELGWANIKTEQDLQIELLKTYGGEVEALQLEKSSAEYKRTVLDVDKQRLNAAYTTLAAVMFLSDTEKEAAKSEIDNANKIIELRDKLNKRLEVTKKLDAENIVIQARAALETAKGNAFLAQQLNNIAEIQKLKDSQQDNPNLPSLVKDKEEEQALKLLYDMTTAQYDYYDKTTGFANEAYDRKMVLIDLEAKKMKDAHISELAIAKYVEDEKLRATVKWGEAQDDYAAGVKASFAKIKLDIITWGKFASETTTAVYKSMSDTLSTVFIDAWNGKMKKAGEYLQSFAQSVLKVWFDMIAQMIARWAMLKMETAGNSGLSIIQSIFGAISGTGGGGGGGGGFNYNNDWTPMNSSGQVAHTGGVFGFDSFPTRDLASAVWANAPRFHTGIGPGERPAIIQNTEGVFTAGQMKALGLMIQRGNTPMRADSGSNLTISVPVNVEGNNALASELRNEIETTVIKVIRKHS